MGVRDFSCIFTGSSVLLEANLCQHHGTFRVLTLLPSNCCPLSQVQEGLNLDQDSQSRFEKRKLSLAHRQPSLGVGSSWILTPIQGQHVPLQGRPCSCQLCGTTAFCLEQKDIHVGHRRPQEVLLLPLCNSPPGIPAPGNGLMCSFVPKEVYYHVIFNSTMPASSNVPPLKERIKSSVQVPVLRRKSLHRQ